LFNQRGRLSAATTSAGTTNYIYNALGQLTEKNGAGGTTLLIYNEAGHLLGEYSSTGALIQETVWMGETPVATLRPNGSTVGIYYVHTDHLNAPRVVTQSTDNSPRWLWGGNAANQNPLGLGTFVYNLRYPGQYFQAETGLNYNYFRDHDPATGRYIESDPIGLKGGINTYVYAGYNPINRFDRRGLFSDPMGDEARALASDPLGDYLEQNPDVAAFLVIAAIDIVIEERLSAAPAVLTGDTFLAGRSAGAGAEGLGSFSAAETTAEGGQLFTTVGTIAQPQVTPIVTDAVSMGNEVSVLSGVHGATDGNMVMSVAMFQSDVAEFGGLQGVTVYDMNALLENPSSLTAILNGRGTIIGAFCNSGKCLAPYR
jgi:RHS repeat-associated protein